MGYGLILSMAWVGPKKNGTYVNRIKCVPDFDFKTCGAIFSNFTNFNSETAAAFIEIHCTGIHQGIFFVTFTQNVYEISARTSAAHIISAHH